MLQAALLLLGCALTLYLWDINITTALVILSITSSSVAFYIFVTSAGTASESCPYQTPGSHIIRFLWPQAKRALHSAFRDVEWKSKIVWTIKTYAQYHHPWWSRAKIMPFLGDMVLGIPCALVIDVHHLVKVIVQLLVTFAVSYFCCWNLPSWFKNSAVVCFSVTWSIFHPGAGGRPTTNCIGLAMHFMDAPDILGQSCPPLNLETPNNNDATYQL